MDQAANRLSEITYASLCSSVESTQPSTPPDGYQARKESGWCVDDGCPERQSDDCLRCPRHRKMRNASSARYIAKRRTAKKLCSRCVKRPRARKSSRCLICLKATGRQNPGVDRSVDRPAWREDLEQSPDGKLRARTRYHGQGKRGRQSIGQLTDQSGTEARKSLERGLDELAVFHSDESKQLPRIQRDDIRSRGNALIAQVERWCQEIRDLNGDKSAASRGAEEGEADE
jgi:hypothetical protein